MQHGNGSFGVENRKVKGIFRTVFLFFFLFFLTIESFHLVCEQEVQNSPPQYAQSISVNGQKTEKRADTVPTSCFSPALRPLPGTPIVPCNNNFSPVKMAPLCQRETSTSILPPVIPAIWRRRVSRSWPPIIMTSFRSSRLRNKVALLRPGLLERGRLGGFSGWTTEEPNNRRKKRKKRKKWKRVTFIYRRRLQKSCVLGVTES